MVLPKLSPRLTALLFGALLIATTVGRADDQDTVDYRKHIMKTMGEQVASINMILQQKAPPDNFIVHVKILAVTASTAKKAFEPKVSGGDAKPEIWSNWADFSKRLDALVATTAEVAKLAQAGGIATAGPKIKSDLPCKDCHDTYRVPKK